MFSKFLTVNYEMLFRDRPQAKKLGVFCYNRLKTKNFFAEDRASSPQEESERVAEMAIS